LFGQSLPGNPGKLRPEETGNADIPLLVEEGKLVWVAKGDNRFGGCTYHDFPESLVILTAALQTPQWIGVDGPPRPAFRKHRPAEKGFPAKVIP
jgi:hypothetical protein